MPYYRLWDKVPGVHPQACVHPTAVVPGDVHIHYGSYIGPGAVLRGDWGGIRIGAGGPT